MKKVKTTNEYESEVDSQFEFTHNICTDGSEYITLFDKHYTLLLFKVENEKLVVGVCENFYRIHDFRNNHIDLFEESLIKAAEIFSNNDFEITAKNTFKQHEQQAQKVVLQLNTALANIQKKNLV